MSNAQASIILSAVRAYCDDRASYAETVAVLVQRLGCTEECADRLIGDALISVET